MVRLYCAMLMSTPPQSAIRELDHRANDAINVRLLWNSRTNHVFVAVEDKRSGESFALTVPPADAFDAFHHPYAYRANNLLSTVSAGTA